jgi:hypothetical protein
MNIRKKTKKSISYIFVTIIALSQLLAGCMQDSDSRAPTAVIAYYQALVAKDYNRMVSNSCAAWETQAKTDYDSFAAVNATVKDISCKISNREDDVRILTCTGKIIADYGNEVLEIDLSKQAYKVIKEAGDWRMCGYQ